VAFPKNVAADHFFNANIIDSW